MLFNSFSFAIFLPIVFLLYWFVFQKSLKVQNILILAASYLFYSCWDWRFLFLLLFSTALDYFSGLQIEKNSCPTYRKYWFYSSIGINLGFLGVFKYFDFFSLSFQNLASKFGFSVDVVTLNIILPVGISFYTFHGLSYVIDVYKKRITAEKNFVDYAVFVSYFPLLVAGPIERATHLLPQIKRERVFDYKKAIDGLNQIIWGLFKKIVIADSCAQYANEIFNNYSNLNSISLILGAIYFAFQIYGDFSGYSDIALGTSKLFGIDLLKNFNYPYFSRDIAEFWRRWHISLSSWFKDYLYIPLGGSQGGKWSKIRNTFIIFLVSGFWHGANWTFIIWGLLNAIYFIPLLLTNKNRVNIELVSKGTNTIKIVDFLKILLTFSLTTLAWIFFRAKDVSEAFLYIKRIFKFDFSGKIQYLSFERYTIELLLLVFGFILIEWFSKEEEHPIMGKYKLVKSIAVVLFILIFGSFSDSSSFIYFQF